MQPLAENEPVTFKPHFHEIPRKGDPWEESFKLVQKFDEEMCRGWREEIDTLLVFVRLPTMIIPVLGLTHKNAK
jgi:hypothetical protein